MTNTLTPSLYARIRPRRYAANRVVSFFGNDVVLTGRVTSDLVTPRVWADFNYDMSTGDYTLVKPDMYMLMGTVNDITKATYIEGRTRYDVIAGAVATATKVYCNESSEDFSPNIGYFWILDNHMPQIRLSTEDAASRTQKTDWNRPYAGIPPRVSGVRMVYADYVDSTTGKLRIAVDMSSSAAQESGRALASILTAIEGVTVLAGSLSGYMFIADIDPGKQWAETILTDSGGVTQTRYWFIHAANDDFPPDVGSLGNTIENRFDSGWTMTLPAIAGVDDLLPNTFAAAWRTNQQTVLADGTWKTGDLWGGASADITNKVLTSNVATLTTNTTHTFLPGQSIIVISNDSVFNGTFTITAVTSNTFSYAKIHANVGSASATGMAATNADNVDFGGWMQTENDTLAADMKYSVLSQANFTFTGIGPRMAKLFGQQLGFLNAATATAYEQIVNCTPYRVIARFLADYCDVATLANIDYDAYDNTYLFSACIIQAQDMLSACKALLYQINAVMEWSANGGLHIGRDATYLSGGERAPLPVLVSWTGADPMGTSALSRDNDPTDGTGKVDADGTFYQTDIVATGQVFTSRSPGSAQGAGAGNDSLRNQILAATALPGEARDELSRRAGSLLDFDNLNEFLHCVHRDATVGLADWASRTRFYWWILAGDEAGPNGVNRIGPYDSSVYWLLDSRTSVYNPDHGAFDEKRDYRRLILPATPGDDTTQLTPDPGSIEPALPPFVEPAFDFQDAGLGVPEIGLTLAETPPAMLAPPAKGSLRMDGNELFTASATKAYLEKNVVLQTIPTVVDITPELSGTYEIQQILTDPYSNFPYTPGVFELQNDGTDSIVQFNGDGTSAAGWTPGDAVSGTYSVIRATKNAGGVLIANADASGTTWTHTFNFLTSDGGFVPLADSGSAGNWSLGVGWDYGDDQDGTTNWHRYVNLGKAFSATITSVSFTYDLTKGGFSADDLALLIAGTGFSQSQVASATSNGTGVTYSWSGSKAVAGIQIRVECSYAASAPGLSGSCKMTACTISGTGTDPFGGGGGTGPVVRYSSDYGVTFGSELPAGSTSPGTSSIAFDVQSAGGNSFIAGDGAIYRATTIGGAYTSWYSISGGAQCTVLAVPYRTWAGLRNTSNTHPDIIAGFNTPDGSSRTLAWIEGGASPGTVHDITPAANLVFDSPFSVTVSFSHHLLVFGKIAGSPKIFRSSDRAASWSLVASTAATFVRCRRQDLTASASGSNKGQAFIAGASGVLGFTKTWAASGFKPRTAPAIVTLDTVF